MSGIALIGGVGSTRIALEALARHGFAQVDVYGYEPTNPSAVSGYIPLRGPAEAAGFAYHGFVRIDALVDWITDRRYDVILVIGLSQLIPERIINSTGRLCVGFHPTRLPRGRGRAALAWLVLGETEGAATLFRIRPGDDADAGPILAQSVFPVDPATDTVATLQDRVQTHLAKVLDSWLPHLRDETPPMGRTQDPAEATEYGVRRLEDGFVDWTLPAEEVDRAIRAAVVPHPGAFAFIGARRLDLTPGGRAATRRARGVTGRVLRCEAGGLHLIQTGDGAIWVRIAEDGADVELRVGTQLGVASPHQLYLTESRLAALERAMEKLKEETHR